MPRNPTIARVFRLPGWAEIAGSGMMKIFDNWRAAGYMPPVIRNNEPTHWFTIEFHEEAIGWEKVATGPEETTQKQQEMTRKMTMKTPGKMTGIIMGLLKDNPLLSIPELSAKIGKSKSTVERAIRKLHQSGLLKRIGPDKGGYWEVLETIDPEVKMETILPIKITQKTTPTQSKMSGKMTMKMTGIILLLLQDNPALSIPGLAEKLGKSERTIERAIQELRLSGLLKRIGPDKGGYWEVVGPGEDQGVEDQAKDIGK